MIVSNSKKAQQEGLKRVCFSFPFPFPLPLHGVTSVDVNVLIHEGERDCRERGQ